MAFNRSYLGIFGTFIAPVQEHFKADGISFGGNEYITRWFIYYISLYAQLISNGFGRSPVKYALYSAFYVISRCLIIASWLWKYSCKLNGLISE